MHEIVLPASIACHDGQAHKAVFLCCRLVVFRGKPKLWAWRFLRECDHSPAHTTHKSVDHRPQHWSAVLAGSRPESKPHEDLLLGHRPTHAIAELSHQFGKCMRLA